MATDFQYRDAIQHKLKTGSLIIILFVFLRNGVYSSWKKKTNMLKESNSKVKRLHVAMGSLCIHELSLSVNLLIKLEHFSQKLFLPKQSTTMLTSEKTRVNPIYEKTFQLHLSYCTLYEFGKVKNKTNLYPSYTKLMSHSCQLST